MYAKELTMSLKEQTNVYKWVILDSLIPFDLYADYFWVICFC